MDLVEYYRRDTRSMPISVLCPDVDEELDEFYVQPDITVVQISKNVTSSTVAIGNKVLTYSDVFEIGDLKNIYIQGNPGMGKTTYCTKLTLDWCAHITRQRTGLDSQENVHCTGLNFDFLFLISLREKTDMACDVMQMVKTAVISQLSHEHKYDKFLPKALDNERCLVILDGLDEWSHPDSESCRNLDKRIPHRILTGNCVYLTLTRPWKLSEINLKDSEKDVLFEISGVQKPKDFFRKLVNSLNIKQNKSLNADDFDIATEHLSDLKEVPIVAMQLVCIWHESETIADSLCAIYSNMVKMMLERKQELDKQENILTKEDMPRCFQGTKWFKVEKEILLQLGNLAFETLFRADRKAAKLTFDGDDTSHYLQKDIKKQALSVGLLTERKIRSLNKTLAHFSFLHKTFQEFLAAFYLSLQANRRELSTEISQNRRGKGNDMKQLFLFLCGLEPSLATPVSEVLMENAALNIRNWLLSDYHNFIDGWFGNSVEMTVSHAVETLNRGFVECMKNGHGKISLEVSHLCFSRGLNREAEVCQLEKDLLQQSYKKVQTLVCTEKEFHKKSLDILIVNKKVIRTLWLLKVDQSVNLNICTSLQSLLIRKTQDDRFTGLRTNSNPDEQNNPVCLNMLRCKSLEHLAIDQANVSVYIDTDRLHACFLRDHDLSQGNVLQTIIERSRNLEYLFLVQCIGMKSCTSRWFHLDLSSRSRLKNLAVTITRGNVAISINTTELTKCELSNCYLVRDNFAEELKRARVLTQFWMEHCYSTIFSIHDNRNIHLDLSLCSSMEHLSLTMRDISVNINTSLHICSLWEYDLSKGNVLKDLSKCSYLGMLEFRFSYFPATDVRHYTKVCIDMSPCRNLNSIIIQSSDILVKYDKRVVGRKEMSSWNRPLPVR